MERPLLGGLTLLMLGGCATLGGGPSGAAVLPDLGPEAPMPRGLSLFCSDNDCFVADVDKPEGPRGEDRHALLVAVNGAVNAAIRPVTDLEIYGVEDRWAAPLSDAPLGGGARGDCEDYVLEKRRRLIAAGVPSMDLSIAIVGDRRRGRHAILLVRTGDTITVLDSLAPAPYPVRQARYQWIAQQSGPDLRAWHWYAGVNRDLDALQSGASTSEAVFAALLQGDIARRQVVDGEGSGTSE